MSDERLVSPESIESPQSSESIENADPALRPRRLNEFVGQGLGRRNLETFIAASVQRGDALDHTLLYGPPGLGKTTMAQIISAELA